MKTYKVVHFTPHLEAGVFSTTGAPINEQIEGVIRQYASEGWEFVTYQTAHAQVKPGCLGGLFGAKEQTVFLDILIFSK